MEAPNMATVTEFLERSLQNCSLNHQQQSIEREGSSSTTSDMDSSENHHHQQESSGATLELNSHISLPYHYEQCLDLKTGEVYLINWRNGMRVKEDPRTEVASPECDYSDDTESSYDSEESSSESSPCLARDSNENQRVPRTEKENVLVVVGCKRCLMYFMVPRRVGDCPKCFGQLLHFDASQNVCP